MHEDWWKRLGKFWDRSTGGGDVAARPTELTGVQWPTVPRAAGIDQAISWLSEGFDTAGTSRFVFLVGGPGAGKSHAASSLAENLELKDKSSPLALRSYRYGTRGRDLYLVNDATISSGTYKIAPLSHEIDESIARNDHFFACVNRGVLVEEVAQQLRLPSSESAGAAILGWLSSSDNQSEAVIGKPGWDVVTVKAGSYIRAGRLFNDEVEIAEILVVYVDVNSLFEKSPRVRIHTEPEFTVEAEGYEVLEFENRRDANFHEAPASSLFAAIFSEIEPPQYGDFVFADPFAANVESLRHERVRTNVLSVLRAAEITASQRMTFREIWGALTRCLIGGANSKFEPEELMGFVAANQPNQDDSDQVSFDKFRTLAEFRFSQAMFGSSNESAIVSRDPVLRLTNLSDPVRDAIPGRLRDKSDLGWASSISDAFSGDSGGSSPLDALLEGGDGGSNFNDAVTRFDHSLDKSYIDLMKNQNIPAAERRTATAWYGAYLTRLFAVSAGVPAFRREVSAWTVAHAMAPGIPTVLDGQLTTLLKPVRYPDKASGEPLFPIFESRTNPIRGDEGRSRLAIKSRNPRIRSQTRSDSLFVVVEEVERPNVEMLLDFAMIREAMACADGYTGSTELSETTSPRLERFRAMRLVPGNHMDESNYRVVLSSNDLPLKVEGKK